MKNAQPSAIISLAGLVIPLGLGAALALPIYHELSDGDANFGLFCLFIAVAIGVPAFPVLCRILTLLKLLDTTVGVVTLSVGVGNDGTVCYIWSLQNAVLTQICSGRLGSSRAHCRAHQRL